jgi:hypothetical protein
LELLRRPKSAQITENKGACLGMLAKITVPADSGWSGNRAGAARGRYFVRQMIFGGEHKTL